MWRQPPRLSGFDFVAFHRRLRPPFFLCAEHVRQLGGASPLPNLMEVKG